METNNVILNDFTSEAYNNRLSEEMLPVKIQNDNICKRTHVAIFINLISWLLLLIILIKKCSLPFYVLNKDFFMAINIMAILITGAGFYICYRFINKFCDRYIKHNMEKHRELIKRLVVHNIIRGVYRDLTSRKMRILDFSESGLNVECEVNGKNEVFNISVSIRLNNSVSEHIDFYDEYIEIYHK